LLNGSTQQNGIDKPPQLWNWQSILSVMLSFIFLAVLATQVDWRSVLREIQTCNKFFVLLGALCHYFTYPLRGLRWKHCMAHLPTKGSALEFTKVVFFYNFVDNIAPAKLGDLYGAHLARINFNVSRSEAIGSIFFQRTLDAWILLSLALLSSWLLLSAQLPSSVLWALIGGVVIALGSTLLMLTFFLLDKSIPRWIPERIIALIRAFRNGMWPSTGQMPPILAYTFAIWTLEVLWIYFLIYGFDMALTPSKTVFLTVIPLLASAFPFTPAGVGVVELTMFSCLRLVGAASPLASSITLLNRFLDYWLHIGLGILMWLFRKHLKLRTWMELTDPETTRPSVLQMKFMR
jgi:glycosyltransferase 2 family protein